MDESNEKKGRVASGLKVRTFTTALLVSFLLAGWWATNAAAEAIKMRIVIVNPSSDKTHTKDVKKYLPKEIGMQHILDTGGFTIEYDQEQGLFYALREKVELAPLETKSFELVLDDVWMIAEDALQKLRSDTERITEHLSDTVYFAQAEVVAKSVYSRLDEIDHSQHDMEITRQQHIAVYRDNLGVVDGIRKDIAKLEKILVAVGGPPNLELVEESDINLKSPSSKTTWIIIFIVLLFIGILAGTFYFTWHRQAKITENIFSREKDASYSEFKKPSEESGGGEEKTG